MKKSEGITKYEIHWQILRASRKGNFSESVLRETLELVLDYFNKRKSDEAYERVHNYIEALIKGYQGNEAKISSVDLCIEALDKLGDRVYERKEGSLNIEDQISEIEKFSFEERYGLWKDLFRYEKHFCSRRYRHKELECLVDQLWQVFLSQGEVGSIKSNFSYEKIQRFRAEYRNGTNNKKFFF